MEGEARQMENSGKHAPAVCRSGGQYRCISGNEDVSPQNAESEVLSGGSGPLDYTGDSSLVSDAQIVRNDDEEKAALCTDDAAGSGKHDGMRRIPDISEAGEGTGTGTITADCNAGSIEIG